MLTTINKTFKSYYYNDNMQIIMTVTMIKSR